MHLSTIDWLIIAAFFVVSMLIGLYTSKQSGKSSADYFLSGRNMPWWLLGVSMVATTFSADTPNFVTDIVRKDGVSSNWVWWIFVITGMLTVFVYARLWRRSGVVTDLEFYELRYSGKEAAFLRGFRAIYLGVVFNILIMATVSLAAIKMGSTMLGLTPVQTLLIASVVTVVYSALGGLKGILLTDFFQFILAMVGTIWAAIVIVNLPQVGGLDALISNPNVQGKLNMFPDPSNREVFMTLIIVPLAVQWWASYFPGSEPGGGGYIVQRMLAAKDEKNSQWATLFFQIVHYAARPWPWILIALASLIVFPDFASLEAAFPNVEKSVINDDMAYSAMLTFLPGGLMGLVVASLIAAFMSTISTHLNWGSSYVVNDVYMRFFNPKASQKQLVMMGRISTVLMMVCAAILALFLKNAKQAFDIIILMGAGTGAILILRWFWWRINAYSEIAGMIISFLVAIYFKFINPDLIEGWQQLVVSVTITTIGWLLVTFLTKPVDQSTLVSFYKMIKPHANGWKPVINKAIGDGEMTESDVNLGKLPKELLNMFMGIFLVYGLLIGTGYLLYSQMTQALIALAIAAITGYVLLNNIRKGIGT